jgi:hypothetical protein
MRLGVCQVHSKKLLTTTTFFEKVYIIIVTAQFFRQEIRQQGKTSLPSIEFLIYDHSPDRSAGYWPQVKSNRIPTNQQNLIKCMDRVLKLPSTTSA